MNEKVDPARDIDPYKPLNIDERPLYEAVWSWPLRQDQKFEATTVVDRELLKECLLAQTFFSPFWHYFFIFLGAVSVFIFPLILFSLTVEKHVDPGAASLIGGMISISGLSLSMTFLISMPNARLFWMRRLSPWLWGEVTISISANGFGWENENVKSIHHWDSFSQVLLRNNVIWLTQDSATNSIGRYSLSFPLHRDWFQPSDWTTIQSLFSDHPGLVAKLRNSEREKRAGKVRFDLCSVLQPECDEPLRAQFRANANESWGFLRVNRFAWNQSLIAIYSITILSALFGLFPEAIRTWFMENSTLLIFLYVVSMSVPDLIGVLRFCVPTGTKYYQRLQALGFSQAGYITKKEVCIATPASTWHLCRPEVASVTIGDGDVYVSLRGKPELQFVIPRAQFSEADFQRLQEIES